MTDPGLAHRTFIGPMTVEYAEQIISKVVGGRMIKACIFQHQHKYMGCASISTSSVCMTL